MRITQHFLVSGRVQGVSFRFYTKKTAEKYRIAGWVRNLVDGRVEVMAQGTAPDIAELTNWLGIGPERAEVTKVEVQVVWDQEDMKEFLIISDGVKTWLDSRIL
jgi:acylphosphatase